MRGREIKVRGSERIVMGKLRESEGKMYEV